MTIPTGPDSHLRTRIIGSRQLVALIEELTEAQKALDEARTPSAAHVGETAAALQEQLTLLAQQRAGAEINRGTPSVTSATTQTNSAKPSRDRQDSSERSFTRWPPRKTSPASACSTRSTSTTRPETGGKPPPFTRGATPSA
ncbi:hypothetical protein ACFYRY_33935 [Streptomyces sp. NPDC005263]|uniref:hypothetical protein n=1 Tax=Streptomyces sp. NPDC005263 TaxID=3364711 RepID=UPI003687DD8F